MDLQTYALSKKYTDKSIDGALTGIEEVEVVDNTIIFTFQDGTVKEMTFEKPADGKNGKNGVSVTDLYVDYKFNHLMVVFSDGDIQDAGEVPPLQSGASAYEVAVQYGYSGTETEWLASLKGDQGDDGASITARVDPISQGGKEIGSKVTLQSTNPNAPSIRSIELYHGVSPTVSSQPMSDGSGTILTINTKDGTNTVYVYNGDKGDKGDDGTTFTTRGQVDTADLLPETGNASEAYIVGTADTGTVVYIQDSITSSWKNVGPIQGVKGDRGDDAVAPTITMTNYSDDGRTGVTVTATNYIKGVPQTPIRKTILNGIDGTDGVDGADGFSPQCSLTPNVQDPNHLDLDITYKDNNGAIKHLTYVLTKGVDGTSAFISTRQTSNGYILNIRDANNPQGKDYTITNGIDGMDADIVCERNQNDDGFIITVTSASYPDGHEIELLDGTSATISTAPIFGNNPSKTGYRIDITDKDGKKTVELWNGIDCTITETEVFDSGVSVGYRIQISDSTGDHAPFVLRHGVSGTFSNIARNQANDAWVITMTDINGDQTITVPDGISPELTETRNQTDNGYDVSVTDVNGTRTFELKDGISPILSSQKIDDGYRVTMIDKNGTQSFVLKNGRNGTGTGTVSAYIVGDEPFTSTWLSLESDGEPLTPEEGFIYQIKTYASEYDEKLFTWDEDSQSYILASGSSGGGSGEGNIHDTLGNYGYIKEGSFVPFNADYQNFLPCGIDSNIGTYKLNGETINYEIFATSFHKSRDAWKAFDGDYETGWGTTQIENQYLEIKLDKAFVPVKLGIVAGYKYANETYESPSITVVASDNDFATTTQIYSGSGHKIGDVITADINTTKAFNCFRLSVSGASNGVGITEFQIFTINNSGIFKGATDNADGGIGYVPRPLAGQNKEYFLKADGTWSKLPEFTGASREQESYINQWSRYQGSSYDYTYTITFTIPNTALDKYYRINVSCPDAYTNGMQNIEVTSITNGAYVDGSFVKNNKSGSIVVLSTSNGDINLSVKSTIDINAMSSRNWYFSVDKGKSGQTGAVPGGFSSEADYGKRFLANDGTWKYALTKTDDLEANKAYVLKGDGSWSEMPVFKGVGHNYESWISQQSVYQSSSYDYWIDYGFTIPNTASDEYYRINASCPDAYTNGMQNITVNSITNGIFIEGSFIKDNKSGSIVIKSTEAQDISINIKVNISINAMSSRNWYFSVDRGKKGDIGVVPSGYSPEAEYGTKFLANDGTQKSTLSIPDNLDANKDYTLKGNGTWSELDITGINTTAQGYADTALAAAKTYSDNNLTTANSHSDTNLNTAKTYSDDNLDSAMNYSDGNLETAKDYSDENLDTAKEYTDVSIRGKSFNSNALVVPDYNNVLQDRTFLTANTDTTYTATQECVVFYSLITNSNSVVEVNGVNIPDSSANDYLYLLPGDEITFNAAEGSYTVLGLRNTAMRGKIYQNTIQGTTDEYGNIKLTIDPKIKGKVYILSIEGHFTEANLTDSVIVTPYVAFDGSHWGNIKGQANKAVEVTYWYVPDYTATVVGAHTVEFILRPEDVTPSNLYADYPWEYKFTFEQSRSTSTGEATLVEGDYVGSMLLKTSDGEASLMFSYLPTEDLMFQVAVYDGAIANRAYDNYSEDEQIVGTQIDGKPIYQRTLSVPYANNGSDRQRFSLSDFNVDVLTNAFGVWKRNSTGLYGYMSIINAEPNTIYANTWYSNVENNVYYFYLVYGSSVKTILDTAYITIQYTKTTD